VRVIALIVRAGAVVALSAVVVALLVDGTEQPATERAAVQTVARPAPRPRPEQVPEQPPTPVPISITATGDIAFGAAPDLPPDDGRGFFSDVQADLAGDVVLGNLEGTLADSGVARCAGREGCRPYRVPTRYATRLGDAGFTVVSLANDHAFDFGEPGLRQTVEALSAAGVGHTGRRGQVSVQPVGSVDVAIVGFAPTDWSASLTDLAEAKRLVRRAARTADVVVVAMHGGAEGAGAQHVAQGTERYLGRNRGDVVRFAHAVVDAGADLVVGHGPRVLRGMEWYRGRLIAYSLGTLGGYDVVPRGGPLSVGAILRVTLSSDGTFETGRLVPTRMVGAGVPALDPAETAHGVVRELSQEDFGDRAVAVSGEGLLSR
jgi:hypothetical protein